MLQENRFASAACLVTLAYASIFSAPAVVAEEATYLSNQASYCEIFQAINPNVPDHCRAELGEAAPPGGKTRGLRVHQAKQAADSVMQAAAPDQAAPAETDAYAMTMNIRFAFDSYELTADATTTLDRVANVLNSDLMQDKSIIIEGHTDAVGTDNYNLTLSTQRALAVQFYLFEQHFIPMDRLQVTGKGEAELYDPANPNAGLNRRVEFINLNS